MAAALLSLVALIVALIAIPKAPEPAPPNSTDTSCDGSTVAKETMGSVVTLFVRSRGGAAGSGSGEFLDEDGHILTNNPRHLLRR